MRRISYVVPLLLCAFVSSGCDEGQHGHKVQVGSSSTPKGVFRVGVSVKDITPTQSQIESGQVHMGGYGYLGIRGFGFPLISSEATAVNDRLSVRAILIELDGGVVAIAVIDASGIGNRIIHEVSLIAAQTTGLLEEEILIANTHSHNAPDLQGYCGGVSEAYRSYVIDQTVAAISEASRNRTPADLYVSSVQGKSNNRRGWGYTDRSITMVEARRIANDATLCALINFGCHPTILDSNDTELSRDYTGYLVDFAESQLEVPVIFVQGALGDSTPNTEGLVFEGRFEEAQAFGEMVAQEALASMANQTLVDAGLYIDSLTFNHVITNPLLIATYLLLGSHLEYDAEIHLRGLSIQTQVGYARLGNQVQIAVLPGESLTNHGLSIKEAMTTPFRLIICQTTDSLGYLIPTDEWQATPNGKAYEETFAFDRFLGDATRDHVLEMIGHDSALREVVEIHSESRRSLIIQGVRQPQVRSMD